MTSERCPVCGAPAATSSQVAAATAGDSTVEIQGVEAVTCSEGHLVVGPPADVIVQGLAEQLTIAGRRRLRRIDVCGVCDTELTMPSRQTETPVPLVVGTRVVTVLVQCPMVRCPECSQEQVGSAEWNQVRAAVDAALASIEAGA